MPRPAGSKRKAGRDQLDEMIEQHAGLMKPARREVQRATERIRNRLRLEIER
jgi:hypothetical protein